MRTPRRMATCCPAPSWSVVRALGQILELDCHQLGAWAARPLTHVSLWPQPRLTRDGRGAEAKDRLERRLHALVCRGVVPLAVAQRAIGADWVEAYRD